VYSFHPIKRKVGEYFFFWRQKKGRFATRSSLIVTKTSFETRWLQKTRLAISRLMFATIELRFLDTRQEVAYTRFVIRKEHSNSPFFSYDGLMALTNNFEVGKYESKGWYPLSLETKIKRLALPTARERLKKHSPCGYTCLYIFILSFSDQILSKTCVVWRIRTFLSYLLLQKKVCSGHQRHNFGIPTEAT